MKIEKLKNFIENNNSKVPLSFNNLVFKENNDLKQIRANNKSIVSEDYKDSDYSIHKFYKPITRF